MPIHVCLPAMLHGSLLDNGPRSSIHEAVRFSRAPAPHQGAYVHNGRNNDLGKTALQCTELMIRCGKSGVNCQVPPLACPPPPTARLVLGLAPPRSLQITHFANPTLTKPCKSDVWHFSDWGRKAVAYHLPLPRSANCIISKISPKRQIA
jgi:hypothetical protein